MDTALTQVSQPDQWVPCDPAVFADTESGGEVGARVFRVGRSKVSAPQLLPAGYRSPEPTASRLGLSSAHHQGDGGHCCLPEHTPLGALRTPSPQQHSKGERSPPRLILHWLLTQDPLMTGKVPPQV